MRRVLVGDVLAAAGVVLGVAHGDRAAVAQVLIDEAHAADRMRKRLGRAHPVWGGGSLMAASLARGARPVADLGCDEAMAAVMVVLAALRRRRAGRSLDMVRGLPM